MVIEILIVVELILVSSGLIGFYGIGWHFNINNNFSHLGICSLSISTNL